MPIAIAGYNWPAVNAIATASLIAPSVRSQLAFLSSSSYYRTQTALFLCLISVDIVRETLFLYKKTTTVAAAYKT